MQVVEFLGTPGSGKSTIAARLEERMPDTVSLRDAVRVSMAARGEDRIARVVARLSRSADSRMWEAAYARSTDRFAALTRFAAIHPAAVMAVLEAQHARAARDIGQDTTLGWILNLMARYQLAIEDGRSRRLLIDEGFAQRGVALFAGGFVDEDRPALSTYLEAVPLPDFLVMVETPVEVCEGRLDIGGWSQRLADVDAQGRRRFLQAAAKISAEIAGHLETRGVPVKWVSGTTYDPDSVARLAATLTA